MVLTTIRWYGGNAEHGSSVATELARGVTMRCRVIAYSMAVTTVVTDLLSGNHQSSFARYRV